MRTNTRKYEHMDLRTGRPLWPDLSDTIAEPPALAEDESCDVLIVGSGITGAMAAFHLAEAGLDVVVIDRRPVSKGSTPASTALIQYEIDMPLVELAQKVGPLDAQAAYRATRQTLDDMRDLVGRAGIDCDLIQRPSLYLATGERDAKQLQTETQARQQIGLEVNYLTAQTLHSRYGIDRAGAVRSDVSLELDPWKLTQGLLQAAMKRGTRVYGHSKLTTPPQRSEMGPLTVNDRYRVTARHLLYATGYETPEQFESIAKLTSLKSTFALATPRIDPSRFWPERALMWEHQTPYFYVRTTQDNRIVIGGEDEDFSDADGRDALLPEKTKTLLRKLDELTGLHFEHADYAWAGTFAETDDGLPYIGPAPESPHCLLALGYGGNGITFSLLSAQILRDHILGESNPNARLFGFDRITARKVLQPEEGKPVKR